MECSFQEENFLSSPILDHEFESLMDESALNHSDCHSESSTPKSVAAPAFSPVCSSQSTLHEKDSDKEDLPISDYDVQHKNVSYCAKNKW